MPAPTRRDRRLPARHARMERSSAKFPCHIVGDHRRLLPNIRAGDNLPIAALGQRPERPQIVPGSGLLIDLKANAELVGADLPCVEQASQQAVLRSRYGMEWAGAIEG